MKLKFNTRISICNTYSNFRINYRLYDRRFYIRSFDKTYVAYFVLLAGFLVVTSGGTEIRIWHEQKINTKTTQYDYSETYHNLKLDKVAMQILLDNYHNHIVPSLHLFDIAKEFNT